MAYYLSTADLCAATGYKRRTIARLAPVIPGSERHDGCHWHYKDGNELQRWIRARAVHRSWKQRPPERKKEELGNDVTQASLQLGKAIGAVHKLKLVRPLSMMRSETLDYLRSQMELLLQFKDDIEEEMKARKSQRAALREKAEMEHISG